MNYIYIGRFQPFHRGHKAIIDLVEKMMKPDDTFTVFIGSADQQRTARNPLSLKERQAILTSEIMDTYPNIILDHINDSPYDYELWVEELFQRLGILKGVMPGKKAKEKFCFVGMENVEEYTDKFNEYLPETIYLPPTDVTVEFPRATYVKFTEEDTKTDIHGSAIRKLITSDSSNADKLNLYISSNTKELLMKFGFGKIVLDAETYSQNYAKSTGCKYNSCFMTVDNIVCDAIKHWDISCSHVSRPILLIKRKDNGKLALPGGFAEPYMNMRYNALRELEEETGLTLADMNTYIPERDPLLIDAPYRDPRSSSKCNFVSVVFIWKFSDDKVYKKAKAADDAAEIVWMTKEEIENTPAWKFHADHKKIICKALDWDYFKV